MGVSLKWTKFGLVWCHAVFENGGGDREVPLETAGYQMFAMEWGLVQVRALGDEGFVPAPDNAVAKLPGLPVSLGVDSSTAPKHYDQ